MRVQLQSNQHRQEKQEIIMPPKYYERFSHVPFEEDLTHEFKGHRNVCIEEIPRWAIYDGKASRKPISRNLCGFLNTGQGGTVYCGVADDGTIHGMTLTCFQKDHVLGSVNDVLSRFSPAVSPDRYKVRFVPVLGPNHSKEKKIEMLAYSSNEYFDPELRKRKHVFRGCDYCWCDQDCFARYKNGTLISEYVIEITILPWNPDNKESSGLGSIYNLHPIHADDRGDLYFRRQASLCKYTIQEIATMTLYEAKKRRDDIITRLEKEIAEFDLKKNSPTQEHNTVTLTSGSQEKESYENLSSSSSSSLLSHKGFSSTSLSDSSTNISSSSSSSNLPASEEFFSTPLSRSSLFFLSQKEI